MSTARFLTNFQNLSFLDILCISHNVIVRLKIQKILPIRSNFSVRNDFYLSLCRIHAVKNENANSNRIFSIKNSIPFYCHNPLQSTIILIFQLFPANNFLFFFINSLQSTFYLIDIFCYNSSIEYW